MGISRLVALLPLVACGRIEFDPEPVVEPLSNVTRPTLVARTQLTLGQDHTCLVRTDDTLWCWGGNYAGELGIGSQPVTATTPTQVDPTRHWRDVSAGLEHTCALDDNGIVFCWGWNGDGELGTGDYNDRFVPTRITVPGLVVAIATGMEQNQAITASGTRWAWGDNRNNGNLGIGSDFGPVLLPLIGIGQEWSQLITGWEASCGIRRDDSLWCWGTSPVGAGDTENHYAPIEILPGTHWLSMSTGEHVCAIRDDQSLWCWGDNSRGQLGDGGTTRSLVPQQVSPGTSWLSVSAGILWTCGIQPDHTLWCWGENGVGELGLGDTGLHRTPTQVAPGTQWKSVAGGQDLMHTCGIQLDDSVWCWGGNTSGQLGLGDIAPRTTPTRVAFP